MDQNATLGDPDIVSSAEGLETNTVGDYELIHEIARGGMGVVFRARQKSLDREVALKMILRGDLATEETLRRFRLEAEAVASLDHPHIVPIYEIGEDDGLPYFSMKLIESAHSISQQELLGESSATGSTQLRRQQAEVAVRVAKVARALEHAHQRGVLHRDIKPGNVLIDAEGEPHVTDFGLAKLVDDDDSGLTMSTTALGSPSYMAPEVASGGAKSTTQAADIYGVGAVLYELLTGQPPFRGESAVETMRAVVENDPASPRSLNPSVARDLETIALRCLSKKPASRFSSAGELADELERFTRGEPIVSRPISGVERIALWYRRRPALAGLATALVVIFVLGVVGVVSQLSRALKAEKLAVEEGAKAVEEGEKAQIEEAKAKKESIRAKEESERARKEARASNAMLEFLSNDILRQGSPYVSGKTDITLREAVDNAAIALESKFEDDPFVRALLHQNLGFVYRDLGDFRKAEKQLLLAASYEDRLPANDKARSQARIMLPTYLILGRVYTLMRRTEEALPLLRKAAEGASSLEFVSPGNFLEIHIALAEALNGSHSFEEAEKIVRKLIVVVEAEEYELDDRVRVHVLLARIFLDSKRFAEAIAIYEQHLKAPEFDSLLRRTKVNILNDLAAAYGESGQAQRAIPLLETGIPLQREILGEHHPKVYLMVNNLAESLLRSGQAKKATPHFEEAYRHWSKVADLRHPVTFSLLDRLIMQHRFVGSPERAIVLAKEMIAFRLEQSGTRDDAILESALAHIGDLDFEEWQKVQKELIKEVEGKVMLVPRGDRWQFFDRGQRPDGDWTNPRYDSSEWSQQHSPLGYGDKSVARELKFGNDPQNKFRTTYFRKKFQVEESLGTPKAAAIHLRCDDGAVVYLNGREIVRRLLPEGEIAFETMATATVDGDDERKWHRFEVDPALLRLGEENVLAVELHQGKPDSSDLILDLELKVLR